MADPRTSTGMILSAAAHTAVLLFAAVSFAAKPFEVPPTDSIFVETVPITDFSQMMAGAQTAKPKDAPKPLVEKKAEPKQAENQTAPVSEKPEVTAAASSAAPPPAPEPPPRPEVKPSEPPPAPTPAKPAEAKSEPAPKPEPPPPPREAEALKPEKKPAKEEPRKLASTAPAPPKRPPPQKTAEKPPQKPAPEKPPQKQVAEKPQQDEQSRFNADQIAALLDKRQPRRMAAAGDVLNSTPALGTPRGSAPQLSQNEIDALRARIQQCWNPPAGQTDAKELTVLVRIQFNPDGSLASPPQLMSRVNPGYQQVAAESALRAIRRCAPYSFMPAAKYESWKDIEVNFDPRDLYRG